MTAAFQLTVTNGGDLVSSFDIQVGGLHLRLRWILPAQINLNEEESGIVTVTVTPAALAAQQFGGPPPSAISIICGIATPTKAVPLHINPFHEVMTAISLSKK